MNRSKYKKILKLRLIFKEQIFNGDIVAAIQTIAWLKVIMSSIGHAKTPATGYTEIPINRRNSQAQPNPETSTTTTLGN